MGHCVSTDPTAGLAGGEMALQERLLLPPRAATPYFPPRKRNMDN